MDWENITGFKNTFFYWVFGLALTLVLSMGLALLLNDRSLKGRSVFKSLTFLPYVCASVAMGLIFNMLFDYNAGLINECIKALGGAPVKWLTSTEISCIPPLVLYVFRSVPWYTNIIYSALLNIPAELYEAATVDGAGPVVRFFQITIPSLGNILVFCMLTLTVSAWQIFTEPYLMPGPASSNISISQYLYNSAFSMFKMGYASAIGYILTMILLVFSLIQFRMMKRAGGKTYASQKKENHRAADSDLCCAVCRCVSLDLSDLLDDRGVPQTGERNDGGF